MKAIYGITAAGIIEINSGKANTTKINEMMLSQTTFELRIFLIVFDIVFN
jgi:hypothetical protein